MYGYLILKDKGYQNDRCMCPHPPRIKLFIVNETSNGGNLYLMES